MQQKVSITLKPSAPALTVKVVAPGSKEAQMHPAHQVPVPQPVEPAELVSQDAGNRMQLGADGRLLVTAADKSLEHSQYAASAEWVIEHGLGKYPSVTVIDSAGDEVEGDVEYPDANTIRINFSAPFAGRAFLN